MAQRFSLSATSQLDQLSKIAEFVERSARACGLNDQQTYDVQMAIDEACSNIIEHAYGGRPDGAINIVCEKQGKEFVVTIRDFGKAFDPKQVAQPRTNAPLSERDIGGLGLFFMYKLMDRVEFDFSSGQGNRLTMTKKIKGR